MADIQVANTDANLSGNTLVTEEEDYTITGLHTFARSATGLIVSTKAVIGSVAITGEWTGSLVGAQLGGLGILASHDSASAGNSMDVAYNAVAGSGNNSEYMISSEEASKIVLSNGIKFQVAGTGTAGATISFTDALSITSAGNIALSGTITAGTWNGTAVADAYVANDLTIAGGTVNSSVIGGSVAAEATFTTMRSAAGSAGTPSIAFSDDLDTGIYRGGDNAISFSCGGTQRMNLDSSGNLQCDGTLTAAQVDITAEGDLRLQDNTGGEYVGLDAPSAVSGSYTLTFPAAIGSVNQVLSISNTDGTLQWATPETGDITSVVAGAGMTGGGSSGDVTLNVIGTADKITVNANDVTIASTYIGQTSITTLGTIGTGTWQGTAVAAAYGGTGQTSYTTGDLPYASGSTAISKLGIGTANKVLTSSGSAPQWSTQVVNAALPTNVDLGGTLDVTGATTLDSTLTVVDDLAVDTDTLFVDASADKVAIGTTAMDGLLHIQSASAGSVSAHANADELVLENSAHAGMTILAGNTSNANIFFGDAASSTQGQIYFTNNDTTASLNIQNEFGYVNLLPSGGGATGVGIGTSTPDQIVDISSSSSIYPIVQTSATNGNAAWRFKNDAETWEVSVRGDNADKFTIGDITEGDPFFTLAIGTGNAIFAGSIGMNGETAAGNQLDDYEEGTFTPVLTGTTSASGVGYDTQVGLYTKIGNRCFFNVTVNLSSKGTIAGYLKITGLPFTNGDSTNAITTTKASNVVMGDYFKAWAPVYSSQTFMYLFMVKENVNTGTTQMDTDEITNDTEFVITGSYKV